MNQRNRLGCLTTSGLVAAVVTLLLVAGVALASGGAMFSPGPLNAQQGPPLGGVTSHAELSTDCQACHVAPWSSERMDDRCLACHTDIAAALDNPDTLHGAMQAKTSQAFSCRDCHPEHNGPDAPLTVMTGGAFPHEMLGFSLEAHQQNWDGQPMQCSDCHGSDIQTFDQATCVSCHEQADAAFMLAHQQAFGSDCLACHDGVDRFGPGFNHDLYPFQLTGAHASVTCDACHQGARSLEDFAQAPTDCYACHQQDDAHNGQFGTQCAQCHSTTAWKPATFDHNQTAFPLTGAHAQAACEACHQNGVYQGTPTDCYACHQQDDAHNGQFGTQCAQCHSTTAWKPATFDHNQTAFPLTGAHAQIACEACHQNGQYSALPTSCVACHAEPTFHAGAFGTDCQACHSTTAWRPAKFDLPHPEPRVDEGGTGIYHGHTTCSTCQPTSVHSYTCLACHSDNQGGEGEDREEGDD